MRSGLLAVLLVGVALAARPAAASAADPPTEADRQAWLAATAGRADAALQGLRGALAEAVDSARRGSALIVAGEDPPGPPLDQAAAVLEGAIEEAGAVVAELAGLRATLACVRPDAAALPVGAPTPEDLIGIAGQLRASAAAAGPFVERRLATEVTLGGLRDALAALDRDDPQAALAPLGVADAALEQVAAWEEPPPSLPYWVETTGALLAAARGLADAAIAGDADAVAMAAEAYRDAAERAAIADRSLALALAEAGSAIVATPLRRLTNALAQVNELRAATASVTGP